MIVIYKQKGETPLQALNRLKVIRPELASVPLSYAGRLDPMAEGVMLVLVGEECKGREKYLGLDKTYVAEVLFGVGTDTGDVLGIIKEEKNRRTNEEEVREKLQKSVGRFEQKYPTYSSKSFAGSYEDVRQQKPEEKFHDVEIYSAELFEMREIASEDLLEKVRNDIAKVSGDFRQEEILKKWEEELGGNDNTFFVAKIRLVVSSGFYVRQFADDLGKKFDMPALALSIVREKVGEWDIHSCVL